MTKPKIREMEFEFYSTEIPAKGTIEVFVSPDQGFIGRRLVIDPPAAWFQIEGIRVGRNSQHLCGPKKVIPGYYFSRWLTDEQYRNGLLEINELTDPEILILDPAYPGLDITLRVRNSATFPLTFAARIQGTGVQSS